jgi:hypothetical protein
METNEKDIRSYKSFQSVSISVLSELPVAGPRTSSIRVTTVSATKRKLILQNFDFSVTELTNSTI